MMEDDAEEFYQNEHFIAVIPSRLDKTNGENTAKYIDRGTDLEGIYDTEKEAEEHVASVVRQYPECYGFIFRCIPHARLTGTVRIRKDKYKLPESSS
jgi:hypothetical protein